ncbi:MULTISPECIES: hypothetical protein [Curvibacter]|jgi:hypothetical protein|uniref:hypothetical protein n=1 Tax=Curvibacter TaxID=281915 RepID=UPI00035C318C|nr:MULTISPECIES: hypothetical protein [Curvibacter]MBV5291123.1 hypothetical protein [Curvibacter lanceolatus]
MPKNAELTLKLEPALRDAFIAAAKASHQPAEQILQDLVQGFVQRQQQTREYETYLHDKVTTAREQVRTGQYHPASEVEARFAARRAALQARAGRAGT